MVWTLFLLCSGCVYVGAVCAGGPHGIIVVCVTVLYVWVGEVGGGAGVCSCVLIF